MDNLTDTVEAFQATMDALEELSKTINTSFWNPERFRKRGTGSVL